MNENKSIVRMAVIDILLILLAMNLRIFVQAWYHTYPLTPVFWSDAEQVTSALIWLGVMAHWSFSVYLRISEPRQRIRIGAMTYLLAAWIGLRLIRCHLLDIREFPALAPLSRFLWYLYYIPELMVPSLFFLVALYSGKTEDEEIDPRLKWGIRGTLTAILLGILTNDLHQQAFSFRPGFADWNDRYVHRWLYYVALLWIILMMVGGIVILLRKSRVREVSKQAYIPLLFFCAGLLMAQASFLHILHFWITEVFSLNYMLTLELCIQTGLLPGNRNYVRLSMEPGLNLAMADRDGTRLFTAEGMEKDPIWLDEAEAQRRWEESAIRRREAPIPGGRAIWLEDESEIRELQRSLEEVRELLSEENVLIQEENELQRRKIAVQVRRKVYTEIQGLFEAHLEPLWEELGSAFPGENFVEDRLGGLCLHMSFLKRHGNLILMKTDKGRIRLEELTNAVREPICYLPYLGVRGTVNGSAYGECDGGTVADIYGLLGEVMRHMAREITDILIWISSEAEGENVLPVIRVMMNLRRTDPEAWEGLCRVLRDFPVEKAALLESELEEEDGTGLLTLGARRGGAVS